ncbi:MAG: S8 family peptidase [Rhodanobacteraceae bacterium]
MRQFASNTYVGGNFLAAASKDVGLTGQPPQAGFNPSDVDEAKAMFIGAGACTPIDATLPPEHLGHGTHVAGLIGANGPSGQDVKGTCEHCGVAAYRTSFLYCNSLATPAQVLPIFNGNAAERGKVEAVDTGAQVLNMSFGVPNNSNAINCVAYRNQPRCLTIVYASSREAALVASSGNRREELNFPASDKRVISVGGFQQDLAVWDDSPGTATYCPPPPFTGECGSNYSKLHSGVYLTRQEVLGSAKRVLSTFYPNANYADYAECGDNFGTPIGDGIGWCTGTSMSAPQIAGVVGLLRSINPLVSTSEPEPPAGIQPGLRTVLAETSSQAQAAQSWNPTVGYGVPDAAAAAREILGKVAGVTIRNRATPLFRLYSAVTKDFAETTSPQHALSLMITQVHNYVQPSAGLGAQSLVPGYAFPYDAYDPNISGDSYESGPAPPRAAIYVLTTDVHPRSEWPALIALHLMDKPKANGRDYLLATRNDIETLHAGGYNLRTIQGYIYQACDPEPACVPPAAEAIYRACKTTDADCAVFLESERVAFEANGYVAAYPLGTDKKLGYAYPATDSDADGLPDGFEAAIGTSATRLDSDGDGTKDASEFPLAGIAVSDPCAGGTGALYCPANSIFANGFDGF